MAYISLSEKSQTIRYALLTAKVAQVLLDVTEGKDLLAPGQVAILSRGADLIQEITDGATLVEGKEFKGNVLPTEESLSAYGYALSTLHALNVIANVRPFTEYFEDLHARLNTIITGNSASDDIAKLRDFFSVLGDAFREDIEKDRYVEPQTNWTGLGTAPVYAAQIA